MPVQLPSQMPPVPWFRDVRNLGFTLSLVVAICGTGRVFYVAVEANEADKAAIRTEISEVDRKSNDRIQDTLSILKRVQEKSDETAVIVAENQKAALERVEKYAPILALQTQASAVQDTRLSNLAALVVKLTENLDSLIKYAGDIHEDVAVIKVQRGYQAPFRRNN